MERVSLVIRRPSLLLFTCGMLSLFATCGGCVEVSLKRFEEATRVDAAVNRNWREYEQPFASQLSRIRDKRNVTCDDPAITRRIIEIIRPYEEDWTIYWGAPPESPPVMLTFHDETEWLGTIDLYDLQMGVVGNRIHELDCEEAAEILKLVCDCSEGRTSGSQQ